MNTIKVTMMLEPTTDKPATTQERKEWGNALGKSPHCEMTLQELEGMVTDMHLSWCHAIFDPQWIKRDNFQQTQLIVLDVDDKLSPQQAMDKCRERDLPTPNIIYRTTSDKTDHHLSQEEKLKQCKKYRMVWVLDQPVNNLREYEKLLKRYMYVIFPEADPVGATQNWLPGQETIWYDEKPRLDVVNLMCIADLWTAHHCKTSRGKKKRFKKTKLPDILHIGMTDADRVPKTASCLYKYREVAENGTNTIRGFDWAGAAKECGLFGDFYYMSRKIKHPQLLGLYSAMRRIEGGAILWKRLVSENDEIDNSKLAIADWYNSVVKKGDMPWEQLLSKYAPNDPASQLYDRFTDIHFKRGNPALKLKSHPEITLEDAEMQLIIMDIDNTSAIIYKYQKLR